MCVCVCVCAHSIVPAHAGHSRLGTRQHTRTCVCECVCELMCVCVCVCECVCVNVCHCVCVCAHSIVLRPSHVFQHCTQKSGLGMRQYTCVCVCV